MCSKPVFKRRFCRFWPMACGGFDVAGGFGANSGKVCQIIRALCQTPPLCLKNLLGLPLSAISRPSPQSCVVCVASLLTCR